MQNNWRIPSIMELSILINTVQGLPDSTLWSCTQYEAHKPAFKDYHWAAHWKMYTPLQRYTPYSEHVVLSSIFVRNVGNKMYWSKIFEDEDYNSTLQRASRLAGATLQHEYETAAIKVCHG